MSSAERVRIDRLLVESGYFVSRERAQRAILAGQVLVDENVVDKPGVLVKEHSAIRVLGQEKYVGRGALKLEAALDHFRIDPRGWMCLDVGASTGGFTDCLLQRDARRVFAIDVGYNQLAWKIRTDPRVTVLERVNARYLEPSLLGEKVQLGVVDVSFISLTLVLGPIFACLEAGGVVIALIKPQFELEPARIGKGGIVRDPLDQRRAVERIREFVGTVLNREWIGEIPSPILGAKGNREFLACLR